MDLGLLYIYIYFFFFFLIKKKFFFISFDSYFDLENKYYFLDTFYIVFVFAFCYKFFLWIIISTFNIIKT